MTCNIYSSGCLFYPVIVFVISDSFDEHFTRILAIVPLIERINAVHLESVATTRVAMPTIPFPELHKEVFEKP